MWSCIKITLKNMDFMNLGVDEERAWMCLEFCWYVATPYYWPFNKLDQINTSPTSNATITMGMFSKIVIITSKQTMA